MCKERHLLPWRLLRIALYLASGYLSTPAAAQSDSASLLPLVQISARSARTHLVGARSERLDSAQLSIHAIDNIAETLIRRSGFYVKSYGLGSLATTSVRGGSGSQTAVVWNGLPLQSPMLGQLDFALLPTVFADELTLQYGTSTAAWGSGAVGGALLLQNPVVLRQGFSGHCRIGAGSFGWQQIGGAVHYGHQRWSGSTRVVVEQARNDFPFRPAPTLPYRRQVNAQLQHQGVLQEVHYQPKPAGGVLSLRTWWQNAFRQIPPTLTQTRSTAQQTDAVWRTAFHWQKDGRQGRYEIRAAHFHEVNRYVDSSFRQDTRNVFRTWMAEGEAVHRWTDRLRTQAALTWSHARAHTPAYRSAVRQQRLAFFQAWVWQAPRWRTQLDGRIEWIDGKRVPFVPGIGMEWFANSQWQFHARVSRHYRAPALNDQHWQPGGNRALRPENGWSQEIGVCYQNKRTCWGYVVSLSAFSRRIHDWILWARQTGQVLFSPQNIAEVWSRGMESRIRVYRQIPSGTIGLSLGYDYTRSTNERPVTNPRIEGGSQLFYVPLHRAFGDLSIQVRTFQVVLFHQYTGAVNGLNERVPAFFTGSLHAQYGRSFAAWSMSVFGRIENLWNAHYLVVERRPMPGRYFRIGLRVNF